jgi:hypothetical protein
LKPVYNSRKLSYNLQGQRKGKKGKGKVALEKDKGRGVWLK